MQELKIEKETAAQLTFYLQQSLWHIKSQALTASLLNVCTAAFLALNLNNDKCDIISNWLLGTLKFSRKV